MPLHQMILVPNYLPQTILIPLLSYLINLIPVFESEPLTGFGSFSGIILALHNI